MRQKEAFRVSVEVGVAQQSGLEQRTHALGRLQIRDRMYVHGRQVHSCLRSHPRTCMPLPRHLESQLSTSTGADQFTRTKTPARVKPHLLKFLGPLVHGHLLDREGLPGRLGGLRVHRTRTSCARNTHRAHRQAVNPPWEQAEEHGWKVAKEEVAKKEATSPLAIGYLEKLG